MARRMEARAAGILLLVTLARGRGGPRRASQHAVLSPAPPTTWARAAFYRLVDERAEFAALQTRLITELPLFRSMMINPVIAKDVATLTKWPRLSAESQRAVCD